MHRFRMLIVHVIWFLAKPLLALRYRIHVEGLDEVKGLTKALILPNHPAYIDPVVVLSALWPALKPRPMLLSVMFHSPLLFWLPRTLDAVEVPDLKRHSMQAREQTEKAIDEVVAGLRNGHNHILWPAGRARRQDYEILGGTRSPADILRRIPEANVVLVRTWGLWGSMFSYARTGSQPNLSACLFKGIGVLLGNLLFFTPRRPVRMTVQKLDPDTRPKPTREELNSFLENWYNAPEPERPTFVPYHFIFGRRQFKFPPPASVDQTSLSEIKPETKSAVAEVLAGKFHRLGDEQYTPKTKLESLGLDSLDRMELSLAIEQRFGFTSEQVPATIGDLWALAQGLTDPPASKPPPANWFKQPRRDQPIKILGQTIPEAFVRRALVSRRDIAAADDLSGAVSYQSFLVGALAMAKRFRKIHAANVGLMLPASVASDLVFCALQLAGKRPVMMNWTTGPGNLVHAVKVMELTHVVTSRRFVDRIGVRIESIQHIYLEDVRAELSKLELLGIDLQTRFFPNKILERIGGLKPDAPAVVLFTSGSEKSPKAVPLTHRNILSNIESVLESFNLSRQHAMLGFLPAFHSFGLTLTSLMPILGGCRVVHHPDPMDAGALARKIAAYQPTIICGTPTFVSYILDRAQSDDLASVRLVVVGGEKCPTSLFERFARTAPSARLLEGYGITECSPLISGNHPERAKLGSVGQPLPGVHVAVVDQETFTPRRPGEMGMLLVSGPNVFPGYIGDDGPSPFREHDGKRWYITGDLARLDPEGWIYFCGRLKRFLKAGGEMISLPALEEPLVQRFPPSDDGPRVAVEGLESESGRHIVLFTTQNISLSEANAILMEQGFRGVLRLDEVRRVDQIPMLGTGKTDYKMLRRWITAAEG